ncbi:hypothetical protein Ddc_14467 [Ditylenchus destructor]|nr:hypothetical protein Ddc_14467 [Ditylenchus destructor]
MRRSPECVEKQTEIKNKIKEEPKAKKDRSHERITNTATLDNETLVEAFKSLNYCQLAKNSLVSKKFWNLIQTNRHRLALLYVDIRMTQYNTSRSNDGWIKLLDKKFSPEEYSEWVIRNNYSQQIAIKGQYERNFYELTAEAYYKDCNHRHWDDKTSVFSTCKAFNHENWPVFQHFVRLVTDPFIYIRSLKLTPQSEGLNLLAEAVDTDRDRMKCEKLFFQLETNSQIETISWIKGHVVCHKFEIYNFSRFNFNEELLDFFMTGASCTSKISVKYYDLSKVIFDFVQKFMDLKKFDENQIVQSIKSKRAHMDIRVLTRNYAQFIVKKEVEEEKETALTIFHFINNDIGKKMELTIKTFGDETNDENMETRVSLKIENL